MSFFNPEKKVKSSMMAKRRLSTRPITNKDDKSTIFTPKN